jgi:hypothetical protein
LPQETGESPGAELTGQHPNLTEQGIPHETLVASFRSLIKEQQDIHAKITGFGEFPHEPKVLSPERAVRSVLDWYAGSANGELGENLFTVRSAWDALSYDRYEPGSREEGLAGSVIQAYYSATREPNIKLTNPMQVRVLDALTEAAGVPHQQGQTEIEIPEKLRNYNQYLMSPEYQARLTEAQAKKKNKSAYPS